MDLSPNAQSLLDALGNRQRLPRLTFDANGFIPFRLDEFEMALGYRAAWDCFILIALVDPEPELTEAHIWRIFETNRDLSTHQTRLALDPTGKCLVLVADIFCRGLDVQGFEQALDHFGATLARLVSPDMPRNACGSSLDLKLHDAQAMIFRA